MHRMIIVVNTMCQSPVKIDALIRLPNGTQTNVMVQPNEQGQAELSGVCTDCEISVVGKNEHGMSVQSQEMHVSGKQSIFADFMFSASDFSCVDEKAYCDSCPQSDVILFLCGKMSAGP